jgi:hypothetical protein
VWRNAAPAGIDGQTVRVAIASPVPAGLSKDTVVYLFEQGPAQAPTADGRPQGKQYLGEFRVSEAAAQQVTLVPVHPLDEFESRRLSSSAAPWVIYETMPPDRYAVFAGMSEEELKQTLPPQSIDEYLRHGKEAKPDDDVTRQAGYDESGKRLKPDDLGKAAKKLYQRRLRDYASEFDKLAQRRVAMEIAIDAVDKDNQRLEAALASAEQLKSFREGEIKRLNSDLTGIKKERQAIDRHLGQVQQQLAESRELLAEMLKRNSQMAAELASRQLRSPN